MRTRPTAANALRLAILSTLLLFTAASAGAQCSCDCDGNGQVGVGDLLRLVLRSLARADVEYCPGIVTTHIQIDQLVSCVAAALQRTRCTPRAATPTATATATRTVTPSPPPTPTLTLLPSPDEAAAALATDLLASIASSVCQTAATPGGYYDVRPHPAGATLDCGSFTGHEGRFDLVRHPSTSEAERLFGDPEPEESLGERGGGLLRELRWKPPCCPHLGGVSTRWKWQRECWLAGGTTFDDTHYIFSPQGPIVVDAILESGRLDELLSLCDQP